jgi:hypothetical protein
MQMDDVGVSHQLAHFDQHRRRGGDLRQQAVGIDSDARHRHSVDHRSPRQTGIDGSGQHVEFDAIGERGRHHLRLQATAADLWRVGAGDEQNAQRTRRRHRRAYPGVSTRRRTIGVTSPTAG